MNESNWAKWSSIAEIISSVAILVTLIYLAIQTQQTKEAVQASGRQATTSLEMQLLLNQAENPEIWASLLDDDFTDVEKAYYNSWLVAFFRLRELDWFNYQNGIIGEDEWKTYQSSFAAVLTSEPARVWWNNTGKNIFDPGYSTHIENFIKDLPTTRINDMLINFE